MRTLEVTIAALLLAAAAPAQVVINEVNVGSIDWLELANLGASPQPVGGWRILASGDDPSSSPVTASYTIPAGTSIPAGGYLVITESSSLSVPSVPGGVQRLYFGTNIFWHGSGIGAGGVCTLTDGVLGVDTVNWLNPANTDPAPPATFPVSLAPLNGDAIYRNSLVVPGTVADWSSDTSGTPGLLNPGQEPPPGLKITLSSTASTFTIDVDTQPMPVPGGEIFCLFSSQSHGGAGPLFGIGLDAFEQLLVPIAFNLPFHALLDGSGDYTYSFSFPVPPGLHIESVSLLIESMALSRHSDVFFYDS